MTLMPGVRLPRNLVLYAYLLAAVTAVLLVWWVS